MTDLQIVFMGSPDFAVPSLQALVNSFHVSAVVTQPDRPAGRGREPRPSPVKLEAVSYGIPVLEPSRLSSNEAFNAVRSFSPDLIIVAAYGQILRRNILELPRFGCLNVHASLLPRWRGASPVQAAILAGDSQTGVTIMQMDEGVDTGPILTQRAVPLPDTITGGELFENLSQIGAELLIHTVKDYVTGMITPHNQQDSESTYASMLNKDDGELDFRKPSEQLAAQIRAFEPWPGSFIFHENRRIMVRSGHALDAQRHSPGSVFLHEGLPAISCAVGALALDVVQPSGKIAMRGEAFLHGARTFIGAIIRPPGSGTQP